MIRTKLFLLGCLALLGVLAFAPKAKTTRVVFLGDSITQAGVKPDGYISLLRNALERAGKGADYELVGAGISGNKVPDLQKRLEADVLAKKPDMVFVYIGINDVWHFTHPSTVSVGGTLKDKYEAGLQDVISRIKKSGAQVVLCTPTVIGEKHDGTNEQDKMLEEYAAISRQVAQKNNLPLCDLRKAFIEYLQANNAQNEEKGVLTSDRVHLNAAGNAFVALQMMPFLEARK
ncbi:SGNH/GDSL hydrolase family protein [soil metagenome]